MPAHVSRASLKPVVLVAVLVTCSMASSSLSRWVARTPSRSSDRANVSPGIDVLRETGGEMLRGKRLGLITNPTGRAIDGAPTWKVLRDELQLRLVVLLSPEHGLSGTAAAGVAVDSGTDPESRLPVYSLYGETRRPTPEMLQDIDVLIFDIQDIGVRFYTYISTLKLAMEEAARAGVEVVVLDRPNPNTGVRVQGPLLDLRFQSFVGIAPIPVVHGMTVGELAALFNGEGMLEDGLRARLQVVPVRGWRRSMWWGDTGLAWRQTSPNIRTAETTIHYPALGLFEGINVSEGRGTVGTFHLAGAPWIHSESLVATLEALELPGVRFRAEAFTPRSLPAAAHPIYEGELCRGFRLEVDEPDRFRAVWTGLAAVATIRRLHPADFEWKKQGGQFVIDRLLGTDVPRKRLEAGDEVEAIVRSWEAELDRFRRRRAPYLLYP